MSARVAILISGSGSNMVALAHSMTGAHPGRVCLVASDRSEAAGLAKAEGMGIATAIVPHDGDRHAFEQGLNDALDAVCPDVICLAGFMRVVSAKFVARWRGRILNIHPSLLPRHRGLHTHARALAGGDAEHGCSVHLVTAELDDGPVLGQARLPVAPGATPESLATRVLALEHRLYPLVLARFLDGETGLVTLT